MAPSELSYPTRRPEYSNVATAQENDFKTNLMKITVVLKEEIKILFKKLR